MPGFGYRHGFAAGASPNAIAVPLSILGSKLTAWFDLSDPYTTCFQDFTGTAAAIGQPVALQLDKKPGVGALGAELVTNGDFSAGSTGWTLGTGAAVSSGGLQQPNGTGSYSWRQYTTTAERIYKLTYTIVSGRFYCGVWVTGPTNASIVTIGNKTAGTYTQYFVATASTATFSFTCSGTTTGTIDNISVKEVLGTPRYQSTLAQRPILGRMPKSGRRNIIDGSATMATQSQTVTAAAHTLSFTGTGTVTLSGTSTAGPLVGTGASNRVSLTFTPTAGSLTLTVTGSVTDAQLELGSTVTNYQTTTSAYDCTEVPYASCYYLQADGSDDGMVTPSLDLSSVSAIAVFAGLRKLSDAARGAIIGLSSAPNSNNGTFEMFAPGLDATADWRFTSRGTALATAFPAATYPAPQTAVVCATGNIGSDQAVLRINGVQAASSATDQGTGNYGNYPLYFYRRGGSSLPFRGMDFGCVIATGTLTTAQITTMERYIARNTPEVSL